MGLRGQIWTLEAWLGGGGRTDVRMYGWTDSPVFQQDFIPFGAKTRAIGVCAFVRECGDGSGCGVGGGRGFSWDGPLITDSSIFEFIEMASQTEDEQTRDARTPKQHYFS